jgi:beta-1,4-mannosyl-glycoprotein beta-1,4-N-acetylglucosaminyltransferase
MKSLKISIFFALIAACCVFFWPKAAHQPKIYDCFLFYNELELLEIRLNEMYNHVDKFVLVEACETFRGKPKPFYFAENKHLFEKFADKIIHVQLKEPFKTDNPWLRERYQRSQTVQGLKGGHPEDIVFISDLDEIIRGSQISEIAHLISSKKTEAVICQHTMYNGYLNRFQMDGWRGSVGTTLKRMKKASPHHFRRIRNQGWRKMNKAHISKVEVIPNAGWHFTSMGGVDRTVLKIESFSHAEHDTPEFKNKQRILEEIRSHPLRAIDETFPKFVQDNQQRLEMMGFIDPGL